MSKNLTQRSKFISLVLRHQPELIGAELDTEGWLAVETLLAGAQRQGVPLTRETLMDIVASSDKQRFALSPCGTRIRANQGHSVEVDLALEAQTPPELLYHGTVERFLGAIRSQGLRKQQRHHVHLSAERATAESVGSRRGEAVVLGVRSGAMHRAGHTFYRSANGVWLVEAVPTEFIDWPVC